MQALHTFETLQRGTRLPSTAANGKQKSLYSHSPRSAKQQQSRGAQAGGMRNPAIIMAANHLRPQFVGRVDRPRFRAGAPRPAARHSGTRRCAPPPRRPLGGCSRHRKPPQGAFPPQRQRKSPHCSAATGPAVSVRACNVAHTLRSALCNSTGASSETTRHCDYLFNVCVGKIRKDASSAAKCSCL